MKRILEIILLFLSAAAATLFGLETAEAAGNEIEWNYYENGQHLVINGENPTYGTPSETGTVDLDGQVNWNYEAKTVEFASFTQPTNVNYPN